MANKRLLLALALVSPVAVSIFYSLYLVAFIGSLIFLYKILGRLLSPSIFNSHFVRAVCTVFFYAALLEGVILTSWLVFKNTPLDFSILVIFLIILIVYIVTPKSERKPTPLFQRLDLIAIAATFVIAASTIFSSPKITEPLLSGNTNLLIQAEDDRTHLRLLTEKVVNNRGILYQTNAVIILDSSGYPAGWHAANGAILMALDPGLAHDQRLTIAYIASKLFWVFILLFAFCRVTLGLASRVSKRKLSLIGAMWIVSSLYVIGRIFIADVYISGFYSFIPPLISSLLVLLLLLQLSESKTNSGRTNSLFLVIMIVLGGCLAWMLPLPAVGLTVIGILGLEIKRTHSLAPIKHFLTKPLYVVPLALLAIGTTAQLYIMLTTKASNSYTNVINFDGGVLISKPDFYVFLTLGLALFLWLFYKKNRAYFISLLWAIIPLFVFIECVSVFQLITTGHNSYYFYKLLNLLTTMVVPLSICGFYWLITRLENSKHKWLAYVLFLVLFFACLVFFSRPTLHIFE